MPAAIGYNFSLLGIQLAVTNRQLQPADPAGATRPSAFWRARRRWRAFAIAGYSLLTLAFSWPLPLHLGTHLTGPPTGDTGVYVWNMWVFQHELVDNRHFPFVTTAVLSLGPETDLALHNYTPFADVLGLPLVGSLGVVAAFNVVFLVIMALTAYATYLLVSDVAGDGFEAWLGGLLLAFSPALVARSTAHFSLVAAAPLPIFVFLLRRAEQTGNRLPVAGAGATVAWATYCDPYYGVYCLMLGAWHLAARTLTVESRAVSDGHRRRLVRLLDVIVIAAALLSAVIIASGGWRTVVAGHTISLLSPYTPMLVLTVAALGRFLLARRVRVECRWSPEARIILRGLPGAVAAGAVLLSPLLMAIAIRVRDGRWVEPRVFWRSGTPGVDLLAYVMPNPNHPLLGAWLGPWLASRDGGFVENVASVPFVVLAVIAAAWLTRARLDRYWLGLASGCALLALGPFVHVAGWNTYVPGPWAFLRYVPIIGSARAPARFTAVVMMAVAVLFTLSLVRLVQAYPSRRRAILALVGAALLFELLPLPRTLYSAVPSPVYARIAADVSDVRVLELPFGVRDGLSSFGNFNASAQYNQAYHGKRLVGGYLSRVSPKRVDEIRSYPVLRALMLLSDGQALPSELEEDAKQHAAGFIRRAKLGYVVVARLRASPELVAFATAALDLELIEDTQTRLLFRPRLTGGRGWLTQADSPDPGPMR